MNFKQEMLNIEESQIVLMGHCARVSLQERGDWTVSSNFLVKNDDFGQISSEKMRNLIGLIHAKIAVFQNSKNFLWQVGKIL